MLDEKDLQAIANLMEAQENRLTAMMDTKLEAQKQELTAMMDSKLEAQEKRLTAKIDQTRNDFRIILEAEVNPKFDLVMEGYENLLQTLAPKAKVDELEDEVIFLRGIVKNLAFDVAELKKAK